MRRAETVTLMNNRKRGLRRAFAAAAAAVLAAAGCTVLGDDPPERGELRVLAGSVINYESVLLSLNASGRLPEPLTIVYPRDGVVTADYPLTQLASASQRARDAHRRLADYLTGPDGQRRISLLAHRRAVRGAPGPFPAAPPELPFPDRLETVNALVAAYYDEYRRPSRTIYVLDVSRSMQGERISRLRASLVGLTGADNSLTSGFQRFHAREEVTLIPFSDRPETPRTVTVPEDSPEPALAQIRSYAEGLRVGGQTAVYDGLLRAYELAREQAARDPDRFTTIVLMTDGENARGTDLNGFRSRYGRLPGAARAVPVFPILFGEAAAHEMAEVAALTGGRTFDARTQSLETVFKQIRDYQ
ncbi:hypothetical protein GCM10022214_64530 [Actinomadura miaoliensis]|uniref:VWFA domain-containing protein n=2 Tax=Actinomadura miaoliensis TaxID=430685 RepID=A0ABP7WR93_9ACTN